MRALGWLIKPLAALIIVAVLLVGAGLAYFRAPLTDAPGIGTRLVRYLSGTPAETARYSAYPELKLRIYPQPPKDVFHAAVSAVHARGWRLAAINEQQLRLRAVADYPIGDLKGDIEVWVTETEGGHSELHVRSDTRGPWPDLGANTRRVMDFETTMSKLL